MIVCGGANVTTTCVVPSLLDVCGTDTATCVQDRHCQALGTYQSETHAKSAVSFAQSQLSSIVKTQCTVCHTHIVQVKIAFILFQLTVCTSFERFID